MVLPLSLFALVVIGALVAGALGLAMLEQRTGRNMLYAVQAAGAAEAGAVAVLGGWAGYGLDALLPGDSAVLAPVELPGGSSYRASVHRLNPELFELRLAGLRVDADGGLLARRELGLILRRPDSASSGVAPLATRAWDLVSP
jgi:hypothetical protein